MTAQTNTKEKLVKAARNCQQNFYELLSDWNSYNERKPHYLKNFIGTALFGPPQIDQLTVNASCLFEKHLENEIFFHESHQRQTIDKIYEKILRHGVQNTPRREIMCGLIYNVIFDMSTGCDKYFTDDHAIKCVQPVPIFKVLKNILKRTESGNLITTKLQVYYIDDSERVYKSWTDYLNYNVLPQCFMVVPKSGEYQADCNQWSEKISYVSVEMYKSPSCNNKTIRTIDSINTFLGLGCAGIGLAAALNPVGGTLMALGAVGMGISGLWSMGRNSQKMADRHLHEQSIGIRGKDGLLRWFGLTSSILTVATSGGSMILSNAIQNASSVSTAAKIVHSSAQIGSIAASGVDVGFIINNIHECRHKHYVSAQDVLNLVLNLLLFTNSAVDLQFANSILKKNQTELIQDFENSLRNNRHRREFRRMVKNSTSLPSNQNTPEQIIRSTVKISDENVLSTSIIREEFSVKIEVSLSDGSIKIDGKHLMMPLEFVKKLKKQKNYARPVNVALTTNYSISNNIFEKVLKNFLARYKTEFTDSELSLTLFSSFLNHICEIDNPDVIFSKLLLICITLVRKMNKNLFKICKQYFKSNAISETVDFLWEFIQANLREKIGSCRGSKNYRELIMKIIIGIHSSVRSNIDEWIDSFKYYLLIKVRCMQRKIDNDVEGKLYLLQVM